VVTGSSLRAQITNNTVTDNLHNGIAVLNGSDFAVIADNTVTGNSDDGIRVSDSSDVDVTNNVVTNNAANGMTIEQGSDRADIRNNRVSNNGLVGISVGLNSDDAQISRNIITGNGFAPIENLGGIYLGPTVTGATINQNNIAQNRDYGLWNGSGNDVDATGNWWGPGTEGHGPSYYHLPPAPFPAYVDIRDQGNVDYSNWAAAPFPLP
jgi:parallel beta-helix repeat protein